MAAKKRRRGKVKITGEMMASLLFKTGVLRLSSIEKDPDRDIYEFFFESEDESLMEIPEGSDCKTYKLESIQRYFEEQK